MLEKIDKIWIGFLFGIFFPAFCFFFYALKFILKFSFKKCTVMSESFEKSNLKYGNDLLNIKQLLFLIEFHKRSQFQNFIIKSTYFDNFQSVAFEN